MAADSMAGPPVRCPICGTFLRDLYHISRFSPPLTILECEQCGFQQQANIPSDSAGFALLYDRGYYDGTSAYSYQDERTNERFQDFVWQARLRNISRHVPPPADLLDVGCSFGGFVDAATRFGYDAQGLDLSQYAVTEGRKLHRPLHQGSLDSASFKAGSFDVITLIEVIEHLPDPQGVAAALARLLREDGLLVIQTANLLGLQARRAASSYHYYLPGHLYYYSTRTLRLLLEAHGFERIRFYRGVDFGVLPKLRKMRGGFRSLWDYRRWFATALYHFKSKIAFGDFALTSSMVCYARKAHGR